MLPSRAGLPVLLGTSSFFEASFSVSRVPSTIASPRNQIDFVLTIFFLQLYEYTNRALGIPYPSWIATASHHDAPTHNPVAPPAPPLHPPALHTPTAGPRVALSRYTLHRDAAASF